MCANAVLDAALHLGDGRLLLREVLGDLMGVFRTDEARMACLEFARLAALGDYYRALGVCRQLMTYEAAAFDRLSGEAA